MGAHSRQTTVPCLLLRQNTRYDRAPSYVLPGHKGALIAVVSLSRLKYLHVVYREVSLDDGFIVTAYVARSVNKRRAIWREDDQ
jgi:hypothetical protein